MTTPLTLTIDDKLPTLHIPWPECGHCGSDVEIEEGIAWCAACRIQWSQIDEDCIAKPDDSREGSDVPCAIVDGLQSEPHDNGRGAHFVPGPPKPCILPSGHEGRHLNPHDVVVTRHEVTE